jgi:hypothetical protein
MVEFNALPDDARVWVFAADRALSAPESELLLREVDAFLREWKAHGEPLTCARDWRDSQFLAVGVDQSTTGASGCSIDGLFRVFKALAPAIGTSLLGGGRVFWRDAAGAVRMTDRPGFKRLVAEGSVGVGTSVFDMTVESAGGWRGTGGGWRGTGDGGRGTGDGGRVAGDG